MEISRIDIESLVMPVCIASPCGEDIMYDEYFLQIKRERQQPDNQNLGVWVISDNKESNWKKVEDLCIELLTKKSKDLIVCSYLLETRFKQYGLLGLSDSFYLMLSLTQKYWDNLFPRLEGEEEGRKSSYLWLDEKLPFLIKTNPLFVILNTNYVLQYQDIESFIYKKESCEAINYMINNKSSDFYRNIVDELEKCNEYLQELKSFLFEKNFLDSNIFYKIFEILGFILKFIKLISKENKLNDCLKLEEEHSVTSTSNILDANISTNNNMNRQEIYNNIKKLAEILYQLEPHSPVPPMILRTLKWEYKSFLEIIFDVLKVSSDKESIMALFGESRSDENSEY